MEKIDYSDEKLEVTGMEPVRSHTLTAKITDVPFEEFLHFALIQRTHEEAENKGDPTDLSNPFGKYTNTNLPLLEVPQVRVEVEMTADEKERLNARRALRQAGWAAVFFLITTDILGPFNAPYAISQLGYLPGVLLYVIMGILAFYCGILLWRLFIHLDSDQYPIKTYADIAERIFGRSARHVCTVLQSLQLIVNVGVICLTNGQSLVQVVAGQSGTGYICFSLAIVIWAIVGMVLGQIRTLKSFAFLANASVWMNLIVIFVSMGGVAKFAPNYVASGLQSGLPFSGPAVTHLIQTLPATAQINGIMQMVFAYGGAMIFPEIMAEMRRPMDFWKGMAMAQMLIFAAYLMYGVFVYAFQGQYTIAVAYQGVTNYTIQTIGNVISLITGIIAAGLYGNIGIKVAYINIVEDWFNGPSIMSRKGHIIWACMVCFYWAAAFIVGSAVPQVNNISALIAAICILQFSYTFPPILRFGYDVITDAMSEDAVYVPGNGVSGRVDTWKDNSRWRRGLLTGRVWFKALNFFLFIVFVVVAGLGMWGSGVGIQQVFAASGSATSFGCTAPV